MNSSSWLSLVLSAWESISYLRKMLRFGIAFGLHSWGFWLLKCSRCQSTTSWKQGRYGGFLLSCQYWQFADSFYLNYYRLWFQRLLKNRLKTVLELTIMIITNLSLGVIASCILFLLLHRNIKVSPIVRGISGFTLLSIADIFAKDHHIYINQTYDLYNATIALMVLYITYISYKRGFI